VWSEDAKLVALRVSKHRPRDVALPDVGKPGPEPGDAGDLRLIVIRVEIDVEAVLGRLGLTSESIGSRR
jgi:hypothetical protein